MHTVQVLVLLTGFGLCVAALVREARDYGRDPRLKDCV